MSHAVYLLILSFWKTCFGIHEYLDEYADRTPFLITSGFIRYSCTSMSDFVNQDFHSRKINVTNELIRLSDATLDFNCRSNGVKLEPFSRENGDELCEHLGKCRKSCIATTLEHPEKMHMCPHCIKTRDEFAGHFHNVNTYKTVYQFPYSVICAATGAIHEQSKAGSTGATGTLCDFNFKQNGSRPLMLGADDCSVGFQISIHGETISVAQTLFIVSGPDPLEIAVTQLGNGISLPSHLTMEILDVASDTAQLINPVPDTTEQISQPNLQRLTLNVDKLQVRIKPYKVVIMGAAEGVKHWFYLNLIESSNLQLTLTKSGYPAKTVECKVNDAVNLDDKMINVQSIEGPFLYMNSNSSEKMDNNRITVHEPAEFTCEIQVKSNNACFPYEQDGQIIYIRKTINVTETDLMTTTRAQATSATKSIPLDPKTKNPGMMTTKVFYQIPILRSGKLSCLNDTSVAVVIDKVIEYGQLVVTTLTKDKVSLKCESTDYLTVTVQLINKDNAGKLQQELVKQFVNKPEELTFENGETAILGKQVTTTVKSATKQFRWEIGVAIGIILFLIIILLVVVVAFIRHRKYRNEQSVKKSTSSCSVQEPEQETKESIKTTVEHDDSVSMNDNQNEPSSVISAISVNTFGNSQMTENPNSTTNAFDMRNDFPKRTFGNFILSDAPLNREPNNVEEPAKMRERDALNPEFDNERATDGDKLPTEIAI